MLHDIAIHAHNVNGDLEMRSKLQKLQVIAQIPDPPLLRLESESYQAYLTFLQHLCSDKPDLVTDTQVERRLVELFQEVLELYLDTATAISESTNQNQSHEVSWVIPLGSSKRRELAARSPLVVATLQAISRHREPSFEKYLRQFFPLLVSLISCEHGSGEVQVALSDMFSSWIGPALLRPVC